MKILRKNANGQTLLEIVVTMGLGLVVITGIAVVTVNGLKNSQLAKNQSIATKLSQQGLEKVRSIRSQNCTVKNDITEYYWQNQTDPLKLVYKHPDFAVTPPPRFIIKSSNTSPCLVDNAHATQSDDADMVNFSNFKREIELSNLSGFTSVIRVTAIVTWSDYSGDHESRLVTTFGQN
jgi:Tfp pilus assembly protein PilV